MLNLMIGYTPVLKKQGNSSQNKYATGNRKVSSKSNVFQGRPPTFISHPALFTLSVVCVTIDQNFVRRRM
jgi:hypothetical protein